jgi:hypothetical protein
VTIFFLVLFVIGGTIAALLLAPKSATIAGVSVILISVALSVSLFVGITSGLSEFTKGVAIVIGGGLALLILGVGCALGFGMIDAATPESYNRVWDIIIGTIVLGSHAFLGRRLLSGPYGLIHLAWDAFGLLALSRGLYGIYVHRKSRPQNDA